MSWCAAWAGPQRIIRNEEQPQSKPFFTELGFYKTRMPDDIYQLILNRFNVRQHAARTMIARRGETERVVSFLLLLCVCVMMQEGKHNPTVEPWSKSDCHTNFFEVSQPTNSQQQAFTAHRASQRGPDSRACSVCVCL